MKVLPVIAALALALAAPALATASTLEFNWSSGPVTSVSEETGPPVTTVYPGPLIVSLVFDVPTFSGGDFEYSSMFVDGIETITSNSMLATLINTSSYTHALDFFAEGSISVSLISGVGSILLDIYDGGDHFTYLTTTGIFIDHNQGLIFESASGTLSVVNDGVVISQPSPVPLPAGGALLLAALGVLGWRRILNG